MTPSHRLLFAGQALPSVDPTHLRQVLTERFKLTREQADRMFSGKPISLKSFADSAEAERYRAHLTEMGARVWVEAIEPPRPAAAKPIPEPPPQAPQPPSVPIPPTPAVPPIDEIVCPSCGERQPKRTLCRNCGADMPRVLAARQEAEAEAREARLQAQEQRLAPRRGSAPAELALETPSVIGWGLGGRFGRVTYLLGNLAMSAIAVPIVIFGLRTNSLVLMALFMILVAIACLRMTALRCNDLGWSKWLTLIQLLPYIGAAFSFILLIVPGQRNENAHGAPTPIAGGVPMAFCLIIAVGSVVSVRHELGPMLLALAAAEGQFGQTQFGPSSQPAPFQAADGVQVILYSDDSCPDCEQRRRELERAGIPYRELALDKTPTAHGRLQESVARSGMSGQTVCTPILEVNGIVLPKGTGVAELQALLQAGR